MASDKITNEQVEAVINLAKAAQQLKLAPSAFVSTALPDLKLTDEDIQLIAALGKARDVKGIKPEEMEFRVHFYDDKADGVRKVHLSFNHEGEDWNKTAGLSADIINAAKGQMPEDNSGNDFKGKDLGGYVGWQNYATGAIASMDNGELIYFPVKDATLAVESVVVQMEKAQERRRAAAKESVLRS